MTPITNLKELTAAYRDAVTSCGADSLAISDALWERDLDVVPRVLDDDRRWRIIIGGTLDLRVISSECIIRELAFAMINNPDATISIRQADDDESRAYALLGVNGLRLLDERRAAEAKAVQVEVVEAMNAVLGRADG